jgi:hypothetical protein
MFNVCSKTVILILICFSSLGLGFKSSNEFTEFQLLKVKNRKLYDAVIYVTSQCTNAVVTEVWRSQKDNDIIYAGGRKRISNHTLWRAVDMRLNNLTKSCVNDILKKSKEKGLRAYIHEVKNLGRHIHLEL